VTTNDYLNLHQEHNELNKDYTKLYQEQAQAREQIMCTICNEIFGNNRLVFKRHVNMFHRQQPVQAGAGQLDLVREQDLHPPFHSRYVQDEVDLVSEASSDADSMETDTEHVVDPGSDGSILLDHAPPDGSAGQAVPVCRGHMGATQTFGSPAGSIDTKLGLAGWSPGLVLVWC
jgi:hypothetical protein